MNKVLRLLWIVMNILFMSSTAFQGVVAQQKTESDDLRFKWSLIVRIDPDGRNEVVNIAKNIITGKSDNISVSAGDRITIYLEPDKGTYVYLYLLDSNNKLIPLFQRNLAATGLENESRLGKGTYIPGKHKWFSFDEKKGYERFYLLASPEPLSKLEKLTQNYVETEKEQDLARQDVLDEIKGIKSAVVLETPQENPIPFGGGVRTLEIDIADLAVGVEAKGFYSKTIILKHE
jgi:Domain of unknown function (DUF4384)